MGTWTPERDAQLRDLWEDGMTTPLIGEALGVSKNSVIGRAHRLGLPLRRASPGTFPNHRKHVRKPRDKTVRPRAPLYAAPNKAVRPTAPLNPTPTHAPAKKEPVKNGPLSILEVGSVHCRAILGEVAAEKTMMCAQPVTHGSDGPYPYCEQHAKAFYVGTRPRLR